MKSSLSNYTIEDTVFNIQDQTYEVSISFDAPLKADENIIETVFSFVNETDGNIKRQRYQHKNIESLSQTVKPLDKDVDRFDFELDVEFNNKDKKEFFKYLVEDYFETIIGLNETLEEVENGNIKSKSKV